MQAARRAFGPHALPGDPRDGPAGAHIRHVLMRPARSGNPRPQPPPKRQHGILNRHRHGGAFEGKAAIFEVYSSEPRFQVLTAECESAVIALDERSPDV